VNLDARVTIAALVLFFGGDVSYKCIDGWIRRGLLPTRGRDERGRLLVRFGDALDAERRTFRAARGRRRVAA
jgi:hypothetical protein